MSLSAEERAAVVEFRIEKALRAYEQAKGVIGLKYWETIANRHTDSQKKMSCLTLSLQES